jgi:hypothetical protein
MANTAPPKEQVVSDLLDALRNYLPGPMPPSLPAPGVSIFSLQERTVGLGNRLGSETRNAFSINDLKGGRLDMVVCFQLWAATPEAVDLAINQLHGRLLAAKDELRVQGFLRLDAEETLLAEYISTLNAWRKTTKYRVLYEFRYSDTGGAESLIAQIPIKIDSEYSESTTVNDRMVRWDDRVAPPLELRGRFGVVRLSALAFIPGIAPSGTVTLRRTFDGAPGTPTSYPTLEDFLAAVAGSNPSERHGQFTFSALSDFLAAFDPGGEPVELGDWDENLVPDSYESRTLTFEPAIQLPTGADRLEINYQNPAFDRVAVVYLQVTPHL